MGMMSIRDLVGAGALLLVGCIIVDADDDGEVTTGTTMGTGEGSTSSGGGTSSSTGVADTGSSTGAAGPSVCRRTCELPSQCCPPGQAGCPSLEYPFNYDCVDGLCVPPTCSSDAECEAALVGTSCHPVGGLPVCVVACDDDPDKCSQPNSGQACVGTADDGAMYCMEPCNSGFVDCGVSVCDEQSGLCVCNDDDQCAFDFGCE